MTENFKHYPVVLSIAGSDSVGGAGIQADIKTCTALGAYAMTAITAITAQNTQGVRGYSAVTPQLLRDQLDAVLEDVSVDAVKIGMVPDRGCVEVIAQVINDYGLRNVVLDPVAVATSGDRLSDLEAPRAVAELLFPLADIVTPNIPEAMLYLDLMEPRDAAELARGLASRYGMRAVLVKGGHADGATVMRDVLLVRGERDLVSINSERVDTVNTHGTGCSLSSAIAAWLAKGDGLVEAVAKAKKFVTAAIYYGAEYKLGHGHGPINHIYNMLE